MNDMIITFLILLFFSACQPASEKQKMEASDESETESNLIDKAEDVEEITMSSSSLENGDTLQAEAKESLVSPEEEKKQELSKEQVYIPKEIKPENIKVKDKNDPVVEAKEEIVEVTEVISEEPVEKVESESVEVVQEEINEKLNEEVETEVVETPSKVLVELALHEDWDRMLKKYVSNNGVVNYKAWMADKARLDNYVSKLSKSEIGTGNRALAFWINLYNAATVQLILDNYPIKSITALDGGKVWDRKWISVGDKTLSLNNIENDIIRPQFKDARIHFAVNCAAKSCPALANEAFTKENVNNLMNRQTKRFVNNTSYNDINDKSVVVSKIFDWYKEDFGSLVEFLNQYSEVKIESKAQVNFMEYNWALNE